MQVPRTLVDALEAEKSVAFVLDRQLLIWHVNSAWARAADEAGYAKRSPAGLIGTSYLDYIDGPLRELLARRFAAALEKRSGPASVLLETECNTPDEARRLTTHVVPMLAPGVGAPYSGLLLIHTLEVLGPLVSRYELTEESHEGWRDALGLLVQCSGCRRCHDAQTGRWKINRSVVAARPPRTSHGLCPTCVQAYYPDYAA